MTRRRLFVLLNVIGAVGCARDPSPFRYPPVLVMSPYRLRDAVVLGADRRWWRLASQPVRYDDPLQVRVAMYCLSGTTRRGRYVRRGIVASDPRFFSARQKHRALRGPVVPRPLSRRRHWKEESRRAD